MTDSIRRHHLGLVLVPALLLATVAVIGSMTASGASTSGVPRNGSFEDPVADGTIPGWRQAYGQGGVALSTAAADGTVSLCGLTTPVATLPSAGSATRSRSPPVGRTQ